MSADTEPGGMRHDTAEDEPVGGATEPSRPALAYEVAAGDDEVDSLLGRMAPARVAPPVGDVAETNGHDAAKFRGEARPPPRAYPTASPQPPVILDVTPAKPVEHDTVRMAAALDSTVAPRSARPRVWMLLLALGGGSLTAALAIVAFTRAASHGPMDGPAVASAAAAPSNVAPPVATSATSSPPPPSTASAAPPLSSVPTPLRSVPPERAPKASPSNTPARPAPSALPPDIKWSLD